MTFLSENFGRESDIGYSSDPVGQARNALDECRKLARNGNLDERGAERLKLVRRVGAQAVNSTPDEVDGIESLVKVTDEAKQKACYRALQQRERPGFFRRLLNHMRQPTSIGQYAPR